MLDERIASEQIDELVRAMLLLRSPEEAYGFFEDIFTIKELQSVAQRLAVAGMLRDKATYQDIAERTGASTATISRVNRSLNYGTDTYRALFERLKADEPSQESPAEEQA